jgi:hypothetical protein
VKLIKVVRQNSCPIGQVNFLDLSQRSASTQVPSYEKGGEAVLEQNMKQMTSRKFAIAASTIAFTALFTVGWSEHRGVSLSVESAQARRLYISPYHPLSPYVANQSGLEWYAVRAYYNGGPWCGVAGFNAGPGSWTCYSGWDDYKGRNGIGCDPGKLIKGGDGIMYVCQ